jgi:hypothetical protein
MALVEATRRVIAECDPTFWCMENVRGAVPWLGQPRQLLVIMSLLFSTEDVADAWFLVTVFLFVVIPSGALDALRTVIGPVTAVTLGILSAH